MALDKSFVASARITAKNQLKTQVNALLTVLEIDRTGRLVMPDRMPEPRLSSPNSGLYAIIIDDLGNVLWRSRSSLGIKLDSLVIAKPGTELFFQVGENLESPFYYSFGVTWELDLNNDIHLSLVMLNESLNYQQTIQSYRKELIFWLGMAGVLLLIMQAVSLRWGLKPLRRVSVELDAVEHNQQQKILGDYPSEIAQLSSRINLFIENERKNIKRYRNTLGDLAHSLKTPLAVIKGLSEDGRQGGFHDEVAEQVDRMDKIVEYQLKKAASAQVSVIHSPVPIHPIVSKLSASLQKVYAHKNLTVDIDIEDGAAFFGDESDLFELLGNISDNAFKWTTTQVVIKAMIYNATENIREGVTIEVHDDGPGIAQNARNEVLKRGARFDEKTPGQGIGLAVVREIVDRYDGELEIEKSKLGGSLFRIGFPPS